MNKKKPKDRFTRRVGIKFKENEIVSHEVEAKKLGFFLGKPEKDNSNLSAYFRNKLAKLEGEQIGRTEFKALGKEWQNLTRLGSNINQVATHLNAELEFMRQADIESIVQIERREFDTMEVTLQQMKDQVNTLQKMFAEILRKYGEKR